MSINGLTVEEDRRSLPFVPLEREMIAYNAAPVVSIKVWPVLEAGAGRNDDNKVRKIGVKGRLFVTSQRLIFLSNEHTKPVQNLVILFRQLTLPRHQDSPITLVMPWFGANSLKFEFRVLPEQILNNGPLLDSSYTWRCEITLEQRSSAVRDIFQLKDVINSALASNASSGSLSEHQEEETLPEYAP
ncbi:uncharacterized protein LALA0_S01e11628g [Lachancea lanzarotensis]|uniref:LALA0S01e11628g1_1 n=1 Tax=Lachancea lanzarotensis TaxID=1245769 RepID=A0A0C7MYC6_9SACH|nr:uncharacterized protein LALA0_S01e11628g [Lachancea lanzarotensis]CEP60471.1 LALA0S01e11628g1_1 [Lachancea lanzarotensis]